MLVAKPGGGYGGNNDRYLDLRVDHHDDPIEELARLLELHRLYFDRPRTSDLIEPDGALEEEIRIMLNVLGRLRPSQDVWEAPEEYMSWANLEERWAGRGPLGPWALASFRAPVQAPSSRG